MTVLRPARSKPTHVAPPHLVRQPKEKNVTSTTPPSKAERRRLKAAEQAAALAARRRAEQRRRLIRGGVIAVAVLVVVGVVAYLATRGDDPGGEASASAPTVGGDLHTVTSIGGALFVGGHAAVAVSHDDGRTWQQVDSLAGADAMGWAVTPDAILVGGHPGLFRSTDDGSTFAQVSDAGVTDVHALGGAGETVYLASPQAGLLVSTDGGKNWEVRNAEAGRSFMGTILVDPRDSQRLIAPDMAGGLALSPDGGSSWESLGGPMGAMAADWNPTDTDQIVAVGMDSAARSTDGGATWEDLDVPEGTSAIAYADDGKSLIAGVLQGEQAVTYRSTDGGSTWTPTD